MNENACNSNQISILREICTNIAIIRRESEEVEVKWSFRREDRWMDGWLVIIQFNAELITFCNTIRFYENPKSQTSGNVEYEEDEEFSVRRKTKNRWETESKERGEMQLLRDEKATNRGIILLHYFCSGYKFWNFITILL